MSAAAQFSQTDGVAEEDIAIIGLSCRFAGEAKDTSGLWKLLCEGNSAFSRSARFDDHSLEQSPHAAFYLQDDVYRFDARFFDISPKEAKAMDPSQRLMLEVAYEAFESAGLSLDAIAGTDTSVFAAQWVCDYREMIAGNPENAPTHTVTGTGTTLLSNRLSWFFDLTGPSVTVNTACSSGMVALHQGCESIRRGESTMAVIAGANLMLSPDMFTYLRMQNFLSPSGKCKSFDASGDGYGRGEGVASLIIKSMSAAIRDGDPIRAVIRGTGVNQNGRTKGITMPSSQAQKALIEKTYRTAGLSQHETCYVEAHGTGTAKGDPAELEAIGRTIGLNRASTGEKLIVGSVKPAIGHTEACAGLASVIKSVLILETGLVPPNICFENPNPAIKFDEWNLAVPTQLSVLPSGSLRRISVCSTGYAGTNAHAILDDAYHYLQLKGIHDGLHFTSTTDEQTQAEPGLSGRFLFTINVNDEQSARSQLHSLARWCTARQESNDLVRDLAFTMNHKRSKFPWRVPIVASTMQDVITTLDVLKKSSSGIKRALDDAALCFIFSGQGAQWARMGQELYDDSDIFRESIDAADTYLRESLSCAWSVKEELFRHEAVSRIHNHCFSQPLTTVLQVALVDLLRTWKIEPDHIIGHSSGEIAAAYCFGSLTRQAAWRIAYHCGNFTTGEEQQGAMMAVGISEADADHLISKHCSGRVVVACINSPHNVTLAGDLCNIEILEQVLKRNNTPTQRVNVDVAYHSRHMESVAAAYWSSISDICPAAPHPGRKMFSTVTGKEVHASELGPWYWVRNILSPVKFSSAVSQMLNAGSSRNTIFLEVGPHHALQGPLKQISVGNGSGAVEYCSALSRGRDSSTTTREAAGTLLCLGVPVDLAAVNKQQPEGKLLVDLPPYSWRHDQAFNAIESVKPSEQHARSKCLPTPTVPREPCFELEWVIAPTTSSTRQEISRIVLILGQKPSQVLRRFAQRITEHLQSFGLLVDQTTWLSKVAPVKGSKCIVLVEADAPLFTCATVEDFSYLQKLVTDANSMLWLSSDNAGGCIIPGLFRTVRNEIPWSNLTCTQLSASWSIYLEPLSLTISRLAISQQTDNEYRERGGALHVARVKSDFETNSRLQTISVLHSSGQNKHKQVLQSDATYVLAGGLGGLGRSLALYLATLGARHLCFLSRNGADSPKAQKILSQLRDLGVSAAAYKADISNADALRCAVAQLRKQHPIVKGVIQCAMVLQDVSFEKMTHAQWNQSLRPKVQGSSNLAACMPPKDLDFFIMLSSFTGIFGNRTQGNYVAGCVFQDALACEHRAAGGNATSLDLGVMRDVGCLAESQEGTTGILKEWEGCFGLRESELQALVHMAILGQLPAQVITGLPTEKSALAAGISRPFFLDDAKFGPLRLDADRPPIVVETPKAEPSTVGKVEHQTIAGRENITSALCQTVAQSLQMNISEIDLTRSLLAHGADSLTIIDIQSWLFRKLQVNMSQDELSAEVAVSTLVDQISSKCRL